MKKIFKLSNLLFYFLIFLVFLLLGMSFVGITGIAKNQGLAAGAIVLWYGIIFGLVGLTSSIFVSLKIKNKTIKVANLILAATLVIIVVVITFIEGFA